VVTSFVFRLHPVGPEIATLTTFFALDDARRVFDAWRGERLFRPLRESATPLLDLSARARYVEAQSALDALFPNGGLCYWKSLFLDELGDEAAGASCRAPPSARARASSSSCAAWAVPSPACRTTLPRTATARRATC
jgi:FAD/FMN-containing dehydrogenase